MNYVNTIVNKLKNFNIAESIIISNMSDICNPNEIKTYSEKGFLSFLIQKSPIIFPPKILSKAESTFIIRSIINEILTENFALKNLTKSSSFAIELYNLFGRFYKAQLDFDTLKKILIEADLPDEDKNRMQLILKAFEQYTKKLKNTDSIDSNCIYNYCINLFDKYPNYLENIRPNFKNIIIDKSIELCEAQKNLLEKLGANVQKTDFSTKTQNPAAQALVQKYLNPLTADFEEINNVSKTRIINFKDLKEESEYIVLEILEKLKTSDYKPEDFAIITDNSSTAKAFNDLFVQANIPTNFAQTDKDYRNLLVKLIQYLNICENLEKLDSEKASKYKAFTEEINEEINLNFENIISETLENQFTKDKFLSILQNTAEISLIECVKNNLNLLTAKECQKIQNELKKLESLRTKFQQGKLAEFVALSAKDFPHTDSMFSINLAKLIRKINSLEKLSQNLNGTTLTTPEIIEILNTPSYIQADENTNCIKIINFEKAETLPTKEVYIVDLTEKSTQKSNNSTQFISEESADKLSQLLNAKVQNFGNIITKNQELIEKTALQIVSAAQSAQKLVTFSTHEYEDKKQTAPSIFYLFLSSIFKEEKPIFSKESTSVKAEQISLQLEYTNIDELVIKQEDGLKLNASGIGSFQMCPRKFYLSNLLGLKSKSTFAASYGTIAHAIMEVFNRKYLNNYTKETLLNLNKILFNSANSPQDTIMAGFSQYHIDLINATDLLSLSQMKEDFENIINELDKIGFFNNIPDEIISEKSFTFSLPELPDTLFDGRIDAIYRYGDKYKIIDFKTGKDKPQLSYLISENGVNFKNKKGQDGNIEKLQSEYDYQMPIYYLASQYAPELAEYKNKINSIEYLYIRPKNKNGGLKTDSISAEIIEEFAPRIVENLKETIIAQIRNRKYFEPKSNKFICKDCSFKCLCDISQETQDD